MNKLLIVVLVCLVVLVNADIDITKSYKFTMTSYTKNGKVVDLKGAKAEFNLRPWGVYPGFAHSPKQDGLRITGFLPRNLIEVPKPVIPEGKNIDFKIQKLRVKVDCLGIHDNYFTSLTNEMVTLIDSMPGRFSDDFKVLEYEGSFANNVNLQFKVEQL